MPFMRGHAHTIQRRLRKARTLIMKPVHHGRASYTLGSGVRSSERATKKGEMSRRPTIKRSRRLEGPDRDIRRLPLLTVDYLGSRPTSRAESLPHLGRQGGFG